MYGWSQIFFLKKLSDYISTNVVIGMGITLFIGGILNNYNLAYDSTIKIIFYLGIIIFLVKIIQSRHFLKNIVLFKNLKKNYYLLLLPVILVIISFFSSINPDAYNYHDDFQKYFVHPTKMLQTGSVFGGTLNAIGQQTLGGQAFFQSFFLSFIGLNAINIFDSVFCLTLSIFLLLELALKERAPIFGTLIACLVVLIHPQYVNISSIYSVVLFILASIILSLEFLRNNLNANSFYLKYVLTLSFLFSSLVVLKTNNVLFPLIYFFTFIFFLFAFRKFSKPMFNIILITPLLSLILTIPWLIFSFNLFIESAQSTNQTLNIEPSVLQIEPYFKSLFSNDLLFYGGSQLSYTSLTIFGSLLIILTIFILMRYKKDHQKLDKINLFLSFVSIVSGIAIYFLLLFLGAKYAPITHLIRYSIPFIIATIPIGLFFLFLSIPKHFLYTKFIFYVVIIILSINFLPHYLKRITQSYECGSQLSFTTFACSDDYIKYNNQILKEEKKILVQELQKNIPEKKTIMAWINAPFYLDFKRNEIIDISIGGFDNPWTKFPSAEYMIWEYNGFATRSIKDLQLYANSSFLIDKRIAIRTLQHIKKINQLYKNGKIKIIIDNGSVLIFKFL
jgi:hypothetical protein